MGEHKANPIALNAGMPLVGGPSTIIRPYPPNRRFPIPNVWEVWQQLPDGNFQPLGQPQFVEANAVDFLGMLAKQPEFKRAMLFLIRTERTPIQGNCNPELIRALTVINDPTSDPSEQR